jgi:hypothetical protein
LGKNSRKMNLWQYMAIMVHDGIFVGPETDVYKFAGSILHCNRDWFDKAAANIQLLENLGDPRPETAYPRLVNGNVALIDYNEMALNMVDADRIKYFGDEMANAGLDFITERLAEGDPILVHCQMGISRSPSMAFLWMFEHGFLDDEYRYAKEQFREIYRDWMPGNGIRAYLDKRCQPKIVENNS